MSKKYNTKLSTRAVKAIKIMMEKGGSKGDALKKAGYSAGYAKNPQKIFKTNSFAQVLDRAGLTDEYLATGFKEFTKAGMLKDYIFPHIKEKDIVTIDKESAEYKDGGINKKEVITLVPVDKKHIARVISKISGAEIVDTVVNDYQTVVTYQIPDHGSRRIGYEFASKSKGHLATDPATLPPVEHTLTEQDKTFLENLFEND